MALKPEKKFPFAPFAKGGQWDFEIDFIFSLS